jgi:O-antigen/teichoic acid export membrane protein
MKKYLNRYFQINFGSIKRIIELVFIFGIFKSVVYISPLYLAKVLNSQTSFGQFEYLFNLGQLLTSFFSAGLVGSYGYFIIHKKNKFLLSIFHLHFVFLTICLLLVSLLHPDIMSNIFFGSVILGISFADQFLIAAILKGKGKNNLSVIIDSGVYLMITLVVLLIYFQIIDFKIQYWNYAILFYALLNVFIFHLPYCKQILLVDKKSVLLVYKFGIFVLISGPLLILLSNSTRLYIELFSNISEVGKYSVHFRFAAIGLIFSRFAGIILYQKMFILEHKQLDKWYSLLMILILCFNFISFFILPKIALLFDENLSNLIYNDWKLYLLCLFQVTFWINISFFESTFQRENNIKKFLIVLLITCTLLIVVLFLIHLLYNLTALDVLVINVSFLFFVFYLQQLILNGINIEYPKTMKVHSLTGILFAISLLFIYVLN